MNQLVAIPRRAARSSSQPPNRGWGEMPQHSRLGWDADQAVTVLYGAHYRALAQMATLLVNDVVVAEEIVEAAFVAAHAAWRRLRNSDQALSYLQRAVVRGARSHRTADSDPSRRPGPLQTGQLDITPSHALLVAALHALPPRQREALVLRHYAGPARHPDRLCDGNPSMLGQQPRRTWHGLPASCPGAAPCGGHSPAVRRCRHRQDPARFHLNFEASRIHAQPRRETRDANYAAA